jgi:hypothetical protein
MTPTRQDAFVEAIENASANLVNRETSLELRSLSSIRCGAGPAPLANG